MSVLAAATRAMSRNYAINRFELSRFAAIGKIGDSQALDHGFSAFAAASQRITHVDTKFLASASIDRFDIDAASVTPTVVLHSPLSS